MKIKLSRKQGRIPITILHLEGDLALDGEGVLVAAAQQAYQQGARHILLDMTAVPYVSSSGLRALHQVWMYLRDDQSPEEAEGIKAGIIANTYKSPTLKLLNPSKAALKVLNISGYDMFLEIHHNLEEAVASF